MNTSKFKYVVGEAKENEVCDIRLFCDIDEYTANSFNSEFLWVESYIKPSKIRVLINSSGGSVLYGMSIFSVIRNSSIPTECINEGLAASMGSIVWAAGDKSLMRDYAILMIHNPFDSTEDNKDTEGEPDYVKAFRQQIEMIYMKRWGFNKTKVKELMSGKEGTDGTFFTAEEAVKAGIIPVENVLKTSKQKIEKVKNTIEGITDNHLLKDTITSICGELSSNGSDNKENKHSINDVSNLNKNKQEPTEEENKTKTNNMDTGQTIDFNFGAVVASLGFKEKVEVPQVMARITELVNVENKLNEANQTIDSLKIEKAGEVTKNQNLTKELENVKAELQAYKDAEKKAMSQKIESMVQDAINAGKIEDSAKQNWIDMATKNFDLAKATLDSIPARDKISTEIENDKDNVEKVKDSVQTVEAQMAKQVEAVVGKDFTFGSLK